MSLVFAGINSVIGIIARNRKYALILALIAIFILFGWSEGVADRVQYIDRYYNYSNSIVMSESGFVYSLLRRLFNTMGMSYHGWMVVNAAFYCCAIGYVCTKFSKVSPAFPAAMMILYPLCMDATILRQTLGNCIGWYALSILVFTDEAKAKNFVLAGVLALTATLIHPGCIFFTIFALIIVFKDNNKLFWLIVIAVPVLFVFVNVRGLDQIVALGQRIIRSHSILSIRRYSFRASLIVWIKMSIYLFMFWLQMIVVKKNQGELSPFQTKVLKANYIILLLYPLITVSNDLYRIQEMLTIFNYCAVGEGLQKTKTRYTNKNDIVLISITIISALLNLYLLVGGANYSTVLEPFFRSNAFFKW